MSYLTPEEEYELQMADDLEALQELEHTADSFPPVTEQDKNVDKTLDACVPKTLSSNGSSFHSTKRSLSEDEEQEVPTFNSSVKKFKAEDKLPDSVSSQTSVSFKKYPQIHGDSSDFIFYATKSDGTRIVLNEYRDTSNICNGSVYTRSAGLLNNSIASLKLEVMEMQERLNSIDTLASDVCSSKMGSELWVEKYRPRSFVDLLSDEGVNRTLLRWLKLWDKVVFGRELSIKDRTKNLENGFKKGTEKFKSFFRLNENADEHGRPGQRVVILSGPPGLGKTTLAKVIAEVAGYRTVELNASDDRSPDVFRSILEASTQMKSVLDKERRPNCLIIDEIDGAPLNSINVLVSFVKSAGIPKGKKQTKGDIPLLLRPVICICNNQYANALKPLRPISFILNFPPTSKNRLVRRLCEIVTNEGIKSDMTSLVLLCERADNDIRSCLSTIQYAFSGKNEISASDVRKMTVGFKDLHKGLFTIWQEIFYCPKTEVAKDVLRSVQGFGDYEKVFTGLFENYLKLKSKTCSIENISKAAGWLCTSDVLQQEIFHHQSFVLMPYLPYVGVAFNFLFVSSSFPRLSFPSLYYECLSKKKQLFNSLISIKNELSTSLRNFFSANCLIIDILPMLAEILKPCLRMVNIDLYSAMEKQEMKRVIDVMVSMNINYIQERSLDGNYRYILEPNLEEIVVFKNGNIERRELVYYLKQMIAHEVTLEKMRRHETVEPVVVQEAKPKIQMKKVQKQTIGNKPIMDFFVPKVVGNKVAHQVNEPKKITGDIWYHFKEGFSNAVRKNVHMKDIL